MSNLIFKDVNEHVWGRFYVQNQLRRANAVSLHRTLVIRSSVQDFCFPMEHHADQIYTPKSNLSMIITCVKYFS